MFEKLIENWLTNVNELGFQIPFCEMLLTRGFRVLQVSRHSRGEHGKDVVARAADGRLWTFQMKGGDVTFTQWRNELRGQAEDLVRLPVLLPAVDPEEPHTPVLVTNGELRGDAIDSVRHYAELWEAGGSGRLEVWQGRELLAMFVEAHGSFLPGRLTEFRKFVELYVATGEDRIPRSEFACFLERLVDPEFTGRKMTETKRGIESMVLMGSYILEQYERAENHIAAAEGWTVIAATILHVAERENLADERYSPSLDLAWAGVEQNLIRLESEVLSRTNFVSPVVLIADPVMYGARVSLVLGWLCSFALLRRRRGESVDRWKELVSTIKREGSAMKFSGEADWPALMAVILIVQREAGSCEAESILEKWIRWLMLKNRGPESRGVPNPYWLQEKALAWYAGELPKQEEEDFAGQSYTMLSALDMLVRRLRRQAVRHVWPEASRMHLADFGPARPADWFRWRCDDGETLLLDPQQPQSWSAWREDMGTSVIPHFPERLTERPEWILPFALTYPHRMNRLYTRLVDEVFR